VVYCMRVCVCVCVLMMQKRHFNSMLSLSSRHPLATLYYIWSCLIMCIDRHIHTHARTHI
jgi:hypothetical protein